MSISIQKDQHPEYPLEDCCFCFKPTPSWTRLEDRSPGGQVACCQPCSESHEPSEVPSKRQWCNKARERHQTFLPSWEIA